MTSHNKLQIDIADFTILLVSEAQIMLETGYIPYIRTDIKSDPDITIHCFNTLPDLNLNPGSLLFEAENDIQKFYSIYKKDDDLIFVMYNQEKINEVQQIAILNAGMNEWQLYSIPEADGSIVPLKYPFGPIMMHYLTQKTGSVMMHASCIFDGEKGRIFTGFSGNGKSTISGIWYKAGSKVINDDRIILREINGKIFAYNTPMFYRDQPKKTEVHAIYLISHSPENKIKKVTGAAAISRAMAFCIQNNFDKNQINNQLNFFSKATQYLQVYDLGFVPNETVIDFVKKNSL